ncbi:MAG: hypothetical protein AAB904_00580 [Patescibacteria group bacterium]
MSFELDADWLDTESGDILIPPVLPEQLYFPSLPEGENYEERALRYALIEISVRDFQKYRRAARKREMRLSREAEEWLFSDDATWPYSFCNVCEALGWDPAWIRRMLQTRRVVRRKRRHRVSANGRKLAA